MTNSTSNSPVRDEPVVGLAPRYYTDSTVYEQEKQRIFFRTWQYVCHQSQVANTGDYIVFEIADQSLFMVRDREQQLRCFYNVCRHRGHALLEGSGNKNNIVCPYHAWRYGLNGQLEFARNSDNVPGLDVGKICLSGVRVEVFCGFVFVNLDKDAQPMQHWFANAAGDLRTVVPDIDKYAPIWEHSLQERCNWKVALENYNECYHCRHVHRALTQGVIAPESIDIQPNAYTLRHTGHGVASDNACYGFDESTNQYRVFFLWPNFSIQVYPGRIVNTYWWRYHGVDRTTVYRGWLTLNGKEDTPTMQIAETDRDTTFAEDLSVVESVQRGLGNRGYTAGPLILDPGGGIDNEISTYWLNQWVREALGAI